MRVKSRAVAGISLFPDLCSVPQTYAAGLVSVLLLVRFLQASRGCVKLGWDAAWCVTVVPHVVLFGY